MMINVLKQLEPQIRRHKWVYLSPDILASVPKMQGPSNTMRTKRMLDYRSLNDEMLLSYTMRRRISNKQREPTNRPVAQEEKERIKWLYFDMFK